MIRPYDIEVSVKLRSFISMFKSFEPLEKDTLKILICHNSCEIRRWAWHIIWHILYVTFYITFSMFVQTNICGIYNMPDTIWYGPYLNMQELFYKPWYLIIFLQVLPIWEGTSTVMSLDVLRSIQKSKGNVLNSLFNEVRNRLTSLEPELNDAAKESFNWFLIGCPLTGFWLVERSTN